MTLPASRHLLVASLGAALITAWCTAAAALPAVAAPSATAAAAASAASVLEHTARAPSGAGVVVPEAFTAAQDIPDADDKDIVTSFVPPSDELVYRLARERAGPGASPAQIEAAADSIRASWRNQYYHGPSVAAQEALLDRERRLLGGQLQVEVMQAEPVTLTVLAIPVEFAGSDEAVEFSHEIGVRSGKCITVTATFTGPLHNEIPPPGPRDNNTFWMPRFDREFFEKMIFSTEGLTERVRADLIDPEDGQPGIDLAGQTMANYYEEVSAGKVRLDPGPAGVVDWVPVPHSVVYYGANRCTNGRVRGGGGLPGSRGSRELIEDAVAVINERDPEFPWADYDTDGDGRIDHVQFFHAGMDESEGGGRYGTHQIWAHRGGANVVVDDMDTPDDPSDDIRIAGYTMQPENLNLGVLVHEFGHDLGTGDLYTNTGTNDVVWWDLMSTGSHPGRLKGSDPTHMSAHLKYALGWLEPEVADLDAGPVDVVLGQAANPPAGTTRAVRVDLPPTEQRFAPLPGGSTAAWWTGADQNWANLRLHRTLDLTGATGAVTLTFDLNFVTERDWDFVFVEVSTDGGSTWAQLKGYDAASGADLTTPDDYGDPHGRLAAFGGLTHGYTGRSNGWRRVRHDLSAYATNTVELGFRYATDAGRLEWGALVDNIEVRAGEQVLFADPVEGDDPKGWTSFAGSFTGATPGEGWRLSDGIRRFRRYYMLEWRNAVGFDTGLKYTYNTIFSGLTPEGAREFIVDKVPSNVPGLLVWLRDARYGGDTFPNNNVLRASRMRALPSEGPKGGLLLVDAHPEPLRGPLQGRFTNRLGSWPYPPDDNWRGRVQTTNAAFSLLDTPTITLSTGTGFMDPATTMITATMYEPIPGTAAFHDSRGYYPGVEELPEPITVVSTTDEVRIKLYTLADADASTVVPASGYYPPRTPPGFTGVGGESSPPSPDVSTDETMYVVGDARPHGDPRGPNTRSVSYMNIGALAEEPVTGQQSGNPGDHGVHFGFHFQVIDQAADGSSGTVRLWRARYAAEPAGTLGPDAGQLRSRAAFHNVGGAATFVIYSDFDETSATYAGGPAGVPVAVAAEDVVAAVAAGGAEALVSLAVEPSAAVAVAWAAPTATDETVGPLYALDPLAWAGTVAVMNRVFVGDEELAVQQLLYRVRWLAYLPAVKNRP